MSCISVSCLNSRYRVVCVIINDRRSVLDLATFGGEFQIDLLMFISRKLYLFPISFPFTAYENGNYCAHLMFRNR